MRLGVLDPRTGELKRGGWYSWIFWGVVVMFYLYEFFVRVTRNVILPQLTSELHTTAGTAGSAMSTYLWVYAPAQLIVGWLFDRFGSFLGALQEQCLSLFRHLV